MSNAPLRILILMATISLVGIIATQVFWVSRAISNENQQFYHSVQMALNNVVESLCELEGNDIPLNNPVERISNNYFIVRTNNRINLNSIEYLLKAELEKRAILQDFEYGVYDCEREQMVYGDLVQLSSNSIVQAKADLPVLSDEAYYFGLYFPSRDKGSFGELDFWKLSTALTLIVIFSFGYGLFVILKQKRLSAVQRDFVNNITHEFKTPLATLKVAGELFEHAQDVEVGRLAKYGKIVGTETKRLEKQVNQLLKASVLERHLELQKQRIKLSDMLQEVTDTFKLSHDMEVSLTVEPDLMTTGDPDLIQGVFHNLLDNAMKYGGKRISIDAHKRDGLISVLVADDGPGIPPGFRKKVFRKFFRVPCGDRHDVKGFGLGLYFVRKVLQKHRATIAIDEPGNIFHLRFKANEQG